MDDAEAVEDGADPSSKGDKTQSVFDRLTDTSGYTGMCIGVCFPVSLSFKFRKFKHFVVL